MGLDIVELVLRCEEVFEISLAEDQLERAGTVGQLFELICAELHLPTGDRAPEEAGTVRLFRPLDFTGWTRADA